jgi:hypothetical protein
MVSVVVGAAPTRAMSERDANAINQKMNKAVFIASFAISGLRDVEHRPPAIMCRDLRAAKSDLATAAKLAREALSLIGPDIMGEYKTERSKLDSMIKIDADADAGLAECVAKGL